MTARYPAPARIPATLRGRGRADLLLPALNVVMGVWDALGSRVIRERPRQVRADRLTVTVTSARPVADGVVSLEFTAEAQTPLPAWYPGAHIDVHLPSGRKRQYSLCGDPADRSRYSIAVRRVPADTGGRGGSDEMHTLEVGDVLPISFPRNAFPLAPPGHGSSARRVHLIAGGIGITPILPMVRLADRLGVDWTLTYAGRSRASMPFLDALDRFDRVTVLTDDVHGIPTGRDLLGEVLPSTAVYCCGPEPMLAAVREELGDRTDVELHFERFGAPPVLDGRPFAVELANTGEVFDVPADRSVLDVLADAHPDIPYSCHQGFCGTCRVRLLAGDPDHRDRVLTDDERADGVFMPCVSRASGERLVVRADLPERFGV